MTSASETHEPLPTRTPDEADLLRLMIRNKGQAYTDRWAESLLDQARQIGEL